MTWPFSTTASSASRAVPQRCCRRRSTAPPRTTWRSGGSCRGATPWVPRLPGDQEKSMVYGEKYIKIWVYHGFNHGLIMKYITMDKHMWGFSWSSGGFFISDLGNLGELELDQVFVELSGNSKVESWRRAMRSWKKMKGLRTDGVSCRDDRWNVVRRAKNPVQLPGKLWIFGGTATKQLGRWMWSMDHIDSGSVYEWIRDW